MNLQIVRESSTGLIEGVFTKTYSNSCRSETRGHRFLSSLTVYSNPQPMLVRSW